MSHEIESMMYARELPWHGLGTYVGDDDVDSAEAIQAAGLDWRVDTRPVYLAGSDEAIDGHYAVTRDTDNKVFGMVKGRYQPLQNSEAFEFLDSLLDDGAIKYHTAGALHGGKRIWLLAQLPGRIEPVPGDVSEQFMLLTNTHDGSGTVQVYPTAVRVVCANTLALANHKRKKGSGINIRHTKHMHSRLEDAAKALRASTQALREYNLFAQQLAATKMTIKGVDDMLENLIPGDSTRSENARDRIKFLSEHGSGTEIKGVRGTAWGLFNAVMEYATHDKSVRKHNGRADADVRTDSVLFGSANTLMVDAKQAFTELVAA